MAHEVNLGGTIYISSKRAAEIFGYSQDYIGQLARGKQIEARRVSGMWYVLEESMRKHKEKRDEPPVTEEETRAPSISSEVDTSELDFGAEIDFDGKGFISAARAAEITGYSHDYVTQLGRSGKVPSHQIGNRWYVEREALLGHKKEKDSLLAAVQSESVGLHRPISEEPVETAVVPETEPHFSYKVGDDTELLPPLEERAITKEELEREVGLGGAGMDEANVSYVADDVNTDESLSDEENHIRIRIVPGAQEKKFSSRELRTATRERVGMMNDEDMLRSSAKKSFFTPKAIAFMIVFIGVVASGAAAFLYSGRGADIALSLPNIRTSAVVDSPTFNVPPSAMALAELVFSKELEYQRGQ